MRIIKGRKRSKNKKPTLVLKINVIQTENIEALKTFNCNPVCFVTTNTFYSQKTSKLKNSNTHWNQTLKIKLPRNPTSKWLRIIVYDVLPTGNPPTTPNRSRTTTANTSTIALSNSGQNSLSHSSRNLNVTSKSNQTSTSINSVSSATTAVGSYTGSSLSTSSSGSMHKAKTNSYLYLGETKFSLLDLFKRRDTTTSYKFSIEPQWYHLYDMKRGNRQNSSNSDYLVGDILLGFKLECNFKKMPTFQAFNSWRNDLNYYLNGIDRSKARMRSSSSLPPPLEDMVSSSSDVSVDEIQCEKSYSDSELAREEEDEEEEEEGEDIDAEDEIDDEESIEDVNSGDSMSIEKTYDTDNDTAYDSISEVVSLNDEELDILNDFEDEDHSSATDMNVHDIDEDKHISLSSMITALDEYDVVEPEDVERLPFVSENDITSVDDEFENQRGSDEDFDIYNEEKNEDTDSQSNEYIGSRLLHLQRGKRKKAYANYIYRRAKNNFFISKKEHATGVVFMHIEAIKNLPALKNRLSKTNYEMDPFIVISFGRRVFKTSWRKHSLNPEFNEYAAFEVFPHETNFAFSIKVVDKDSFSFNDDVAKCELAWFDMLQQQQHENEWIPYEIPLDLTVEPKHAPKQPTLYSHFKFVSYASLKNNFWKEAVNTSLDLEILDIVQVMLYLERLGSFTVDDSFELFQHFNKSGWAGESISRSQLVEGLQAWRKSTNFRRIWTCPRCLRSCKPTRNARRSKLVLENDLITHFAICTFSKEHKTLKPSYVSSAFASKRWFSKVLIKLTYGKYALGSNNANILVQDRDTGIIIEEKISAHVKLGMRIIYNGKSPESKKFRSLLKTLSVRQGKKFDNTASAKQIEPFIKFHSLDLSQCRDKNFKTFNEFFYRKLKPGSRLPESHNKEIFFSPADSRCTVFSTIQESKEIWIKGRKFSIKKLANNYSPEIFNDSKCSIGIFRLAPQDYHRFHSPCNGKIGKPIYLDGEYYTVNPMAVRSELDVFCENIRVIIPIDSPQFGKLLYIPIGAMMVGSILLTCKENDLVEGGQELGYFKFGGSTIVIVIPHDNFMFDSDLVKNSSERIETLVKVGMSIGHTSNVSELKRVRIKVDDPRKIEQIKRTISVSDENARNVGNATWEYHTLREMMNRGFTEI
ncbi:psd2p [Saccharomyces arboricola H-6]|uniref:Phosphatidylserine decarboxylase proenzyme 2 n=1 Tax=Saccharomyces arboricola (strain H-6 / AS 2.3317 / CBS 10644) TaxID=1160507 RepID=J8Q1M5_SACAR|nr:psd2p [Saccharomyces arboricola H-6]